MGERLRSEASNDASIYEHGDHSAMLLVNGLGQAELPPAYDPVPRRHRLSRRQGDPFEESNRELRLTIASDCKWLDPKTYEDLVRLASYPGVSVDLAPGLSDLGYKATKAVEARIDRTGALPHAAVTTPKRPGEISAGVLVIGGEESLNAMGLSEARARRLALDIAIHDGLRNDYIVSPIGVATRDLRRGTWIDDVGLCSPSEAFGLAGAKARMFRSVPIEHYPPSSSVDVNVGMWRDQAAMWSVWALRRALAGALAPSASEEEKASRDHLLAMRTLLVDALVARDEIYRLTRRDAVRDTPRSSMFDPEPGPSGNDLLQLLRYHAVSVLNHVFALTDNLAWVAVRMTGTVVRNDREVGFAAVAGPNKKAWARTGALGLITTGLDGSPELPYLMAARQLRNLTIHRDGFPYGAVMFHPEPAPRDHVHAFWLTDDMDRSIYDAIGERADLSSGAAGIVVVTFLRFVDELWTAISRYLNHSLSLFDWSASAWLADEEAYVEGRRWDRGWRQPRQARAFRFALPRESKQQNE